MKIIRNPIKSAFTTKEVEQKLDAFLKRKHIDLPADEYDDTVEYIRSMFDDEWVAMTNKEGIKTLDQAILAWHRDTADTFPDSIIKESKEVASGCHGKEEEEEGKKKEIKSAYEEDEDRWFDFRDDLADAIAKVYEKYNFNTTSRPMDKRDFDEVVRWLDTHGFWENPEED